MSEQVLRRNVSTRSRTRTITQIAMLGAIAGILMNLEFPIPFLAPSFYQLDFSEVPVLVGSFAMGPLAGVWVELVKILVHLVTKGTMTAGVGDVANFIFGCAFVVPAGSRNDCRNTFNLCCSLLYQCIYSASGLRKSIRNAG